uniref:Uncharacterized protein n=1 Tax=Timema cristinae TaxID=61476 RepID=A0A7R9CDL0_TIMCR|nr:unnamed protein product [Timema cristinae]
MPILFRNAWTKRFQIGGLVDGDLGTPSYHIQHQVFPAKWSYGVKDSSKHYANFSVIPNYQPLHAKSNGHFPSPKVREADKLATSRTPYDNNMNNMTPMSNMNGTATRKERNGFFLDDNRRVTGVTHEPGPKMGFDLQNVVSMEILESDVAYVEAKNEEVMRRVAEMQELVHSSEQYLTQQQQQLQQQLIRDREREREESDSESSHISSQDSDTPGQLKHSDSLLLLTQGQKLLTDAVNEAVSNIDLGETEPSESDTDSMSTPTNSPSHRSCLGKENESYSSNASLKASDSSFGLHSPDNLLPVGFRPNDHNIQDLLKRLQEDSTLPYNFAEGTLYLDPDIIDLTMIPPPITPDEDGVYALPPQLSLPPTPFADHFPLQTSLQTDYAGSHGSNEQDSLIDNFLDLNLDLEAFLATVTVPPPSHQAAPSVELTPEEIMSFIIPPPPANGEDTTPSLTNGSSKKNTHEILGYKYNPQELGGTKVIEYPTVNRKGGPFSCCGKYKDSPEKSSVIQPPPRNGAENAKPPARPPKTVDYSVKTISGTSVVDVPPILPPRSDASPPHGHLPRKPPLPPGPSQEILKKAQRSPIPVQKISNPVPVENGVHSTGKHSLPRNGYVTSRFINNREVLFSKSDATMVDLLQRLDQDSEELSIEGLELYNIKGVSKLSVPDTKRQPTMPAIKLYLRIDIMFHTMEVDTGAASMLISEDTYKALTNNKVTVQNTLLIPSEVKDLNTVVQGYPAVANSTFGEFNRSMVRLERDPSIPPKYCKARQRRHVDQLRQVSESLQTGKQQYSKREQHMPVQLFGWKDTPVQQEPDQDQPPLLERHPEIIPQRERSWESGQTSGQNQQETQKRGRPCKEQQQGRVPMHPLTKATTDFVSVPYKPWFLYCLMYSLYPLCPDNFIPSLVVAQCSQAQAAGGGSRMDEGSFQVAKASLTEEARQLVTASKLLVKSATSPAGLDLPENLANCLHRLRRLTDLAADLTSYTTSPLQTRNLVVKVRDVASVFRETLVSALNAGTQESLLLARAENLASVLATLLRSLRVFSP